MAATPVLMATMRPNESQETPRQPAKKRAHQALARPSESALASVMARIVRVAPYCAGIGRQGVPGHDKTAPCGANRRLARLAPGETLQPLDRLGALVQLGHQRHADVAAAGIHAARFARQVAAGENLHRLL